MKEIWKSVNIWRSYAQEYCVLFFWLTVHMNVKYKDMHLILRVCMNYDTMVHKDDVWDNALPALVYSWAVSNANAETNDGLCFSSMARAIVTETTQCYTVKLTYRIVS